jgi:putative sterol carrier protein
MVALTARRQPPTLACKRFLPPARLPAKHKDPFMSSVAKVIETMQARFNANAAAGLDLVFQFNIEDAENYYLSIKDGTCSLTEGNAESPNVALIMDSATLKGVLKGEISGMEAFMTGKLRTEGDMMLALKLGDLFPS